MWHAFFQDMNVKCVALLNDTVGCLMSCAFHDHNTELGVILGTLLCCFCDLSSIDYVCTCPYETMSSWRCWCMSWSIDQMYKGSVLSASGLQCWLALLRANHFKCPNVLPHPVKLFVPFSISYLIYDASEVDKLLCYCVILNRYWYKCLLHGALGQSRYLGWWQAWTSAG